MARLSPEEGFKLLEDGVTSTISKLFPIIGKKNIMELQDIQVKDDLDIDDIRSQKTAKLNGRSWSVPVEATIALKDKETGNIINQQKIRLMSLPKITRRYSHIVDGNEYQIDNQWQLKSGVYARIKDNGELESRFNLAKGKGFNLEFDPKTRKFTMGYGSSNIPLKPLLMELGIPTTEIETKWGKEITDANHFSSSLALDKFYKAATGNKAEDTTQAKQYLMDTLEATVLSPETTRITLGKEYKKVTGPSLLDAATKLLHISQGKVPPDTRDALMFKNLRSTEDFITDRLQKHSKEILRKLQNGVDRKIEVRDIIGPDVFQKPIRTMFYTSLSNLPEQTNPLEMISGQMKTTITGEGGIKSEHQITEEAKLIDPSHLGFLDAIHTSEGATTGVTLHLPIGVQKKGQDVYIKMYNLKTEKIEDVNPEMVMKSKVVLPDQVQWKNGKPIPIHNKIKISAVGNDIVEGSIKDAHYVMRDPIQMFSMASNLIPFMGADHPLRSTMAGRHMEQAISLAHREAPLVQSVAGNKTFSELMGTFAGHVSKIDGEVVNIGKDFILVKDDQGKKIEHQLYDHFPLNSDKAFLHSTPLVKIGDKVVKGQAIADSNFTKNGVLALGTNLYVGYLPYKGYNFDDGVVISEAAAKKLSSEHLYRKTIETDSSLILNKGKFQAYVPHILTREQSAKLDDDGVIKLGTTVVPGDTIIAALREQQNRAEDKELAKLHKSLVRPYRNVSERWDADYPGVVTEVIKHGKETTVHIKTLEPMEIGDKLSGTHGNKGIVCKILTDAEMPHTKGGKVLDVLMNATTIPGRVNLGQVLETAAGKIAEKTGKPFLIKNFDPSIPDLHAYITEELKKHGISDKEEVIDPITGKVMGNVLVGPQNIIKLKHQVDKKLTYRAGGPGYVYDMNLIPKRGTHQGGQALDTLGLYSMLAHGAKENLREFQTIRSDSQQSDAFWTALQSGEPLPAPRPTFAYQKFISYLNAMGVNAKKEGNNLQLIPFTDKNVLEMSNGVIKDPGRMVRAKDLKEEKDGLFDIKTTGGISGTKWSHMNLPYAMPNPLFEKSIQCLTGLSTVDYENIMSGKSSINPHISGLSSDTDKYLTSGKAIDHLLGNIDISKELEAAKKQIEKPGLKGNRLDQINKKIRYLAALTNAGLSAKDAYMMKYIPVLPPIMRPLSHRPNGDINFDDLNQMYKGIGLSISRLNSLSPLMPESEKHEIKAEIYDGLRSLIGLGGTMNRDFRGVLDIIQGKMPVREGAKGTGEKTGSPKAGYFQSKLVNRRQDLSMRSTIVPEPSMGLDEVGIPRQAALEIYKPFIIRELRNLTGVSPLEAQKQVKEGGGLVQKALERVIENRPLLLKRDPVLHKYGIQAFKPRIVYGKAVQIHPLVTAGFGADFDGNCIINSSKVYIKYGIRDSHKEKLMPFTTKSKLTVNDGIIVELEIGDFPREDKPYKKDKNGADIYRVPEGIQVLSYDHLAGESTYQEVTELTIEENCETVEIFYSNDYEVTASTNESLCIYNHETGQLRKAKPSESIGALSPVVSPPEYIDGLFNKQVGWAIGLFASDGFLLDYPTIGICKVNQNIRDYFYLALQNMGGVSGRYTYSREKRCPKDLSDKSIKDHITVSTKLYEFFSQCYDPSYINYLKGGDSNIMPDDYSFRSCLLKRLPDNMGNYSKEALLGVLSGLLCGDGSLSLSHAKTRPQLMASFNTSSKGLKEDIKQLCFLLGIRCSVSETPPAPNRVQKRVNYTINFSTVDIYSLLPKLLIIGYDEFMSQYTNYPPTKDDRDVVPIPFSIIDKFSSKLHLMYNDHPTVVRSLANRKSKEKAVGFRVSRDTAFLMLPYLNLNNEIDAYWKNLVLSPIKWVTIQKLGKVTRQTVSDLVIPTTKVFSVNNGLIVWDTMSAFVPISPEAVVEARHMYPSSNIFSPSSGTVMYTPTNEAQLGLYGMAKIGLKTNKAFSTLADMESALRKGEIDYTHQIKVGGVSSTAGRFLIAKAFPESMREEIIKSDEPLNKNRQIDLLTQIGKNHKKEYGDVANKLKDLGNAWSTSTGFSLGMEDIKPDKVMRDQLLAKADLAVSELKGKDKDLKAIQIYAKVTQELNRHIEGMSESKSNLITMSRAGIKPSTEIVRQIKIAPMLMINAKGETIATPVRRSFSEGLDFADYWTSMSGARKGVIQKVQQVREPGYMSKMVMNSVMNNLIVDNDCGTDRGITLSIDEKDILDRYLAADVKIGKDTIKAGTLITSEVKNTLRNNKVGKIMVRSPLRCNHGPGVCQKCHGLSENGVLPDIGTNVGVLAGQALGERSTQLAMRGFHSGGSASSKEVLADEFDRVKALLMFPQILPGSASLSTVSGKIEKMDKDPAGGHNVFIGGKRHYVPNNLGIPQQNGVSLKIGDEIKKGSPISNGPINPHEMLPLTGMEPVQGYLANALHELYGHTGVRRRNTEIVIKALTNLTKIDDPGDHKGFIRGDFAPLSHVTSFNKKLPKDGRPIVHQPILKGVNVLPLDMQEDWMARLNHQNLSKTIIEAAQQGWTSKLHGAHPIPPVVYGAEMGKGKPGEY